jgi:threonine dehydrogenase-like Zn-dependent dehydrogenase
LANKSEIAAKENYFKPRAVWGCGPVGQFAIRTAIMQGAKQVVAIDRVPERLTMAEAAGATTINFDSESVIERLNDLTNDKGPEKCIDAVGMESHITSTIDGMYDRLWLHARSG